MTNALFSGLSGLRSHQQYLNVIGNNLANSNTPGYKASRVTFSDVLSQTLRRGSAPGGSTGGVNPAQLGRGAQVASIDQNFTQGSLLSTGRPLDLALQGEGFFMLSDGQNNLFSRVGALGLDAAQNLVDLRSGFRVQSATRADIRLPLNSIVPPKATGTVSFRGNLPAKVVGPTIEEWTSASAYKEAYPATTASTAAAPFDLSSANTMTLTVNGVVKSVVFSATNLPPGASLNALTPSDVAAALNHASTGLVGVSASVVGGAVQLVSSATGSSASITVSGPAASAMGFSGAVATGVENPATATTPLNDLKTNTVDYTAGDTIRVNVKKADGTTTAASFTYGADGTTLGDLMTFTNTLLGADGSMTLDAQGVAHLTASAPGETAISVTFADDAVSGGGASNFGAVELQVDVEGTKPDSATASLSVYDSLGIAHTLTVTLERQITGEWTMNAQVPDGEGTVASSTLPPLAFDTLGRLPSSLSGTIEVSWAGGAAPQTLTVDFADPVTGEELTQLSDSGAVSAVQDGYELGSLASISVEQDGAIRGIYSNGQTAVLERLGIALFSNPSALERAGNGLFTVSSNSGQPSIATPGAGGSGQVISGSLEGSNVDVAEEFVRLIEAQRGFQANARVISTSNEVLGELTRLGQ